MVKAPIEDLLKQCPSVYKLVVVAAKRAKELAEGAPKFVETPIKKVTSLALEEIRQGKVSYDTTVSETAEDEPKAKKRKETASAKAGGRSAHATEKKKS